MARRKMSGKMAHWMVGKMAWTMRYIPLPSALSSASENHFPTLTQPKQSTTSSRRRRCGLCGGCRAPECGRCHFRLDMKKNGGTGRLKKVAFIGSVHMKKVSIPHLPSPLASNNHPVPHRPSHLSDYPVCHFPRHFSPSHLSPHIPICHHFKQPMPHQATNATSKPLNAPTYSNLPPLCNTTSATPLQKVPPQVFSVQLDCSTLQSTQGKHNVAVRSFSTYLIAL